MNNSFMAEVAFTQAENLDLEYLPVVLVPFPLSLKGPFSTFPGLRSYVRVLVRLVYFSIFSFLDFCGFSR